MPMSVATPLLRDKSTSALGFGGHAMSTYNDWLAALPDKLGKTADDIDLNDLLALTDNRDELGLLPKIFWTKCPVSVTLKDEEGNVLAFESSNANAVSPQLANSSGIVSLVTDNNEKVFFIPFGYETVDINIEAYDYGTMTFATEVAGLGSTFNNDEIWMIQFMTALKNGKTIYDSMETADNYLYSHTSAFYGNLNQRHVLGDTNVVLKH